MAKSDKLFSLIKSLTKSEKRYFKLVSGTTGDKKNYLLLFEAYDQQETYHPEKLTQQFANQPFGRQLHVAKNYLSNLILKSLRAYHLNRSVNSRLYSCLADIEILFKKDLLSHCLKSIDKAEKLANGIGDQRALLEILNWKRKVLLNLYGVNSSQDMVNAIINQEQQILDNLKNESEYWALTMGMNTLNGPSALPKDHQLLCSETYARTHRSIILRYHLLYINETISGNLNSARESIDHLVRYLEENPRYLKHDPGSYITALNNKIGLCLNQRRHQEVPPILEKIRGIPQKVGFGNTSPLSMKLLVRTYNVELETYRDSGQYNKGVDMIPQVRDFLMHNKDYITEDYKTLLHYQFAYLFFMVGSFRNALKDINAVLNHRYRSGRADVVGYAQLLNMIIHYELGNYTVMKYAVDASRRFLKKRGKLMDFEKVLLRLFSRLSTQPDSHHSALFSKVYKQLFEVNQLMEVSQLDYLDVRHWLKSKLEKKRHQNSP